MSQVSYHNSNSKHDCGWLLVILVMAIILRIPHLNGSFWLDEAAQALEIIRPTSQQLMIGADFQPPLLHLLLHLAQFISISEWWLRLVGALMPAVATIYFIYQIGRRFLSKSTGILAALFLATSSFHLFYSQELRPYSLSCLLATWSFYLLFAATTFATNNKQQLKKGNWWDSNWLKIAVINLLGLFSTYLYPFVMVTQAAYLLIFNRSLFIKWLKAQLLPVGGFLLWLPAFLAQLQAGQLLRQTMPGWDQVVSSGQIKALPLILAKFLFGVLKLSELNWPVYFAFGFAFCLMILIILLFKAQKIVIAHHDKFAQLCITLVTLLLIPWLISFLVPIIQPKRLLIALPIFYLIIAWIITQAWLLKTRFSRSFALLTVIVILGINLFGTISYYTKPHLQRENWRDLVAYLQLRFPSNRSLAIFAFEEPFAPWQWYDQDHFPTLTTGTNYLSNPNLIKQKMKIITDYDFVFVFEYLTDLTDPHHYLLQTVEEYGFHEIEIIDRPQIGFIRVFIRNKELLLGYRS